MSDVYPPFPGFLDDPEPSTTDHVRNPRLSILQKLRVRRLHNHSHIPSSLSPERRPSASNTPSTVPQLPLALDQLQSISSIYETTSDTAIVEEFTALQEAVVTHVKRFYSSQDPSCKQDEAASRSNIEHATTGLSLSFSIPWKKIQVLLNDVQLRTGTLAMCIAWTILSRSLLLKLGMSNTPGSMFLPPEMVECFQSFAIGAKEIEGALSEQDINFALLSRWKQISATLMHATYVRDAFSHFDPRTVNVERALNDLEPLLRCYATDSSSNDVRVTDLREVLRTGARFAFTLSGNLASGNSTGQWVIHRQI